MCICMADSIFCVAETNTTLSGNYTLVKINLKKFNGHPREVKISVNLLFNKCFWHISAQNIYLNGIHLERKHITGNQKEINISRHPPSPQKPLPSTLSIWLLPSNIRCVRLIHFLDVAIVHFHCWEYLYYISISWWIYSFFSWWRFRLFPILSIFNMLFWTFLSFCVLMSFACVRTEG